MKRLILIIALGTVFVSCKTTLVTNYKVQTSDRNYYADNVSYVGKDSIQLNERKRNGEMKPTITLALSDVKITEKK